MRKKINLLFEKFSAIVTKAAGRPFAFIMAVLVIASWIITGPIFHYSDSWQLVINTGTTIITFLMVFVIQHTQARQTAATQLKLDELIRASARADDGLIAVEEAPAAHLQALTDLTLAERDWK